MLNIITYYIFVFCICFHLAVNKYFGSVFYGITCGTWISVNAHGFPSTNDGHSLFYFDVQYILGHPIYRCNCIEIRNTPLSSHLAMGHRGSNDIIGDENHRYDICNYELFVTTRYRSEIALRFALLNGRFPHRVMWSFNFYYVKKENNMLTHWSRVTHICVGNLTIIGSDNGLSPGRRQAII